MHISEYCLCVGNNERVRVAKLTFCSGCGKYVDEAVRQHEERRVRNAQDVALVLTVS